MNTKKSRITENDRELVRLLKKVWKNFDFVLNIIGNLENEEQKEIMIEWLKENPGVNHVDVIGQMLEITMKGDLVENSFYEINPDLKK